MYLQYCPVLWFIYITALQCNVPTLLPCTVMYLQYCPELWCFYITALHCNVSTLLPCTVMHLHYCAELWCIYITALHCIVSTLLPCTVMYLQWLPCTVMYINYCPALVTVKYTSDVVPPGGTPAWRELNRQWTGYFIIYRPLYNVQDNVHYYSVPD